MVRTDDSGAQPLRGGRLRPKRTTVEDDSERALSINDVDLDIEVIERVALSDSEEGRLIAAAFVEGFGRYVNDSVRPILRRVADTGGEPQLLVNGLAELLRLTAASIEFPLGSGRPTRSG
jgi:hypothetical protein